MSESEKKFLCDSCIHNEICSLRLSYRCVCDALDSITVGLPKASGENDFDIVPVIKIPWLKPIQPICKHYYNVGRSDIL